MSMSVYDLKPCPFCGATNTDYGFIGHLDACYLMRNYMGERKKDILFAAWNNRPIEDALRAELEDMEKIIREENSEKEVLK